MLKGAAAVALIATLGTFLLYRHTLDYGFHYDDYHFIRPYSAAEVRAAFQGPWDPSGIEVPFYRPLTVAFYAARFERFGLDSRRHHAVSLTLFALAAMLIGAFVAAVGRRWHLAAIATLVFVVHPAMPYSLVAWVTNQMHLIETVVVLLALTWWALVWQRPLAWWLPLLGLGTAAFLIKEDGIMLLPSIVVLHWLRRRVVDPTRAPVPRTFVAAAAVLVVALILIRGEALGGLGGYGRPAAGRAWQNFIVGLDRVFRLVPADRSWQPAASWFATLLPLLALASWPRARPETRYVIAAGACIAIVFNLPFVFVSKPEQMHLVAAGAVLLVAGSAAAAISLLGSGWWRAASALALAGGVATFAAVARDISTDFTPFGPIVLSRDEIVKDWAAVPEELRRFLRQKLEPGSAGRVPPNPVDALDLIVFGLHGSERSPDGVSYRWMSQPRVELHVAARWRRVEIPLRHEIGAFREPAAVAIEADGRPADALRLEDDAWHVSQVTLRPGTASAMRRAHRIRLTIPRVWRPSEVIPGSTDTRSLGLQVGDIRLR